MENPEKLKKLLGALSRNKSNLLLKLKIKSSLIYTKGLAENL